jgi:hypothetical protein
MTVNNGLPHETDVPLWYGLPGLIAQAIRTIFRGKQIRIGIPLNIGTKALVLQPLENVLGRLPLPNDAKDPKTVLATFSSNISAT